MPTKFDDYKDVPNNWMKFSKIGDFIHGTLISRELKTITNKDGSTKKQWVFELKCDEGSYHNTTTDETTGMSKVVDDATTIEKGEYYFVGSKESIDRQMRHVQNGQKIVFILDSIPPSKTKGNSPFKLIKVKVGPMDPDYAVIHQEAVPADEEEIKVDEVVY